MSSPLLVAADASLVAPLAAATATAAHPAPALGLQREAAPAAPADEAPVVRLLQAWFEEAVARGASDLHFEPYASFYRVRVRVDGVLHELARPPLTLRDPLTARLKVLARLDIAERRLPQDGRLTLSAREGAVDCRVSTLPTLAGETIVVRLLPRLRQVPALDDLGYEPAQQSAVLEAIGRPQGMVLVTGPTGSGKTVSLYRYLALLNGGGRNISTVEDPVEIPLAGINQASVNERAGMLFSTVLPALLRQDPDILMVGEIRDAETAATAVRAAQTGHLVLSTVHANDAPATLLRLVDLGVPPWLVAESVVLITAQRLVRRLCDCREPVLVTEDTLRAAGFVEHDLDGGWTPWRPVGCAACHGTGYRGRCGIHQVMAVSEPMRELMRHSIREGMRHGTGSGVPATRLPEQARREGVLTLRQAGLRKVRQGLTSLAEVLAMTDP